MEYVLFTSIRILRKKTFLFRAIQSANQLSILGAVLNWCDARFTVFFNLYLPSAVLSEPPSELLWSTPRVGLGASSGERVLVARLSGLPGNLMHDGFQCQRGVRDRWVDSCRCESGVHGACSRSVWPGRSFSFGLRCRKRSTMCSARWSEQTRSVLRMSSGLRFASAESPLASLVVSASSRCLWICCCCAKSGRYPKACPTAWSSSSRLLASRRSTPTCFSKENPWCQRRTFMVARSHRTSSGRADGRS